ncbi:MAG: hypothetical protein HKN54_09055 [Flavobacteriaceae bacterium]|nr:hypothetical protein [Flavobacteriaceae bacterium]
MNTDKLNTLFEDLKDQFDMEEPRSDHEQRFIEKLIASQDVAETTAGYSRLWKPILGIAASVVLLVTLAIGFQTNTNEKDLASVSPEMATTQDFFTNTIAAELEKLNTEDSPEFQEIIVDALFQIKILEEDYQNLKLALEESGDDQRVIHAMITNFQNRIDILQNVSEQIEELKLIKNDTNENSSTL